MTKPYFTDKKKKTKNKTISQGVLSFCCKMATADFSIYFLTAQSTRERQFQMRNDVFGGAVRQKIEDACAQNLTSCVFNPSAWNLANPSSPVPLEQSDAMLQALKDRGYVASFADGIYSISWAA